MYQIQNLKKHYVIQGQSPVKAIDNISLELPDAGFVGIIGRNGCGKTTLLNMLGGIDRPNDGRILYNGKDIVLQSSRDADKYRNCEIAFVFQDYNLNKAYSVEENVKLALRLQGKKEANISAVVSDALGRVGLQGFEKRKIEELSGGQRQRVVIARAIAKSSRVILCDEPTGNLDSQSAEALFDLLRELSDTHLVITVTHDMQLAHKYCHRVIEMKDGKVKQDSRLLEEECGKECHENYFSEENANGRNCHKLSLKNSIFYAGKNLKSDFFLSICVILILTICFSLMISFYSVSRFDESVAFYNTIKNNGTYTIAITKYVDKCFFIEDGLCYGPSIETEMLYETDAGEIKNLSGEKTSVYPAYFFTLSLDTFTESNLNFQTTNYLADSFNEIVSVPSFENFRQELLYGKYPKEENQILIYDYMAFNMLQHGGFANAKEIADFVGYTVTDKYSGREYHISGILKSNYELYSYVDEKSGNYDFELLYLSSLQTIFAPSALVDELKSKLTQPVRTRYYYEDSYLPSGEEIITRIGSESQVPLNVIDSAAVTQFRFIGDFNPNRNDSGVILSKKSFAEIYGIPTGEVTAERVNASMKDNLLKLEMTIPWVNRTMMKSYQYGVITALCGVYEGDGAEEYLYLENGPEGTFNPDMTFRQFYISLNGSDEENLDTIRKFLPKKQTDEFYEEHQDYYKEGFSVYTSYQKIIGDASFYLTGMDSMGRTLFYLSIALVCGAIIAYGYLVIRNRRFEIGLFKSLGARNENIALVFGVEILCIVISAMILGLGFAPLLMKIIDSGFTAKLKFPISFFRVQWSDYGLPCLIGAGAAIIALWLPVAKLLRLQPVVILNRAPK